MLTTHRVLHNCSQYLLRNTKSCISTTISKNLQKSSLPSKTATDIKEGERLSKLIASTGYCSRRDADKLIINGVVFVNGVEAKIASKVTDLDSVFVEGIQLKKGVIYDQPKVWLVHKLKGELVVPNDDSSNTLERRPTVIDRIRKLGVPETAIPVNRLEFNTEGLCIFTNNNIFSRYLQHNSTAISREFKVRIHGLITQSKLEGLRRGLFIDGVKFKSISIKLLPKRDSTISWAIITISENKSKVLKTCFDKLFLKALRVISTRFGSFTLGDLAPGAVVEEKLSPDIKNEFLKFQEDLKRGSVKLSPTKPKMSSYTIHKKNFSKLDR